MYVLDGRITGERLGLISGRLRTVCASLRRKCFCLVSEQRKTKERDSRLWPREK